MPTVLVVGGPVERAAAFLRAAAPRRGPALFLSPYPSSTRLLVEASRALGADRLLDRTLVSIVPAEASRLAALIQSLGPVLAGGSLSVAAFDCLLSPALRACGDVDSKSRLASALSLMRALARRGGACVLIMEPRLPARIIARQVDAILNLAAGGLGAAPSRVEPLQDL
ncbi:MAG: hypothetical protein QXT74_02845 [Candidatus Nezhaarchaeales archaeon]